jgi:Acetyltransferase (GNAT) domain
LPLGSDRAADRLGVRQNADNDLVPTVVAAQGAVLDHALDVTWRTLRDGLNRRAYGRFHAARMKTPWGSQCQRAFALVEGQSILASAEQYDLTGVLDGRAVRVCGIGPVHSEAAGRGFGYARQLAETLLNDAARDGAEMALLFSQTGSDDDMGGEFDAIHFTDLTLNVAQSPRHGAPMTMVREGEERDLAAIVAMGRVRAEPFRFHLDRDVDFVRYAITTKRLLAGFGLANARQLHFFIAEEGITAAAYVIVSVVGDTWTLEECGGRDASGARVGALLQALIAREPVERRPTIHAWLPPRFLPPQVSIVSAKPSAHTIRVGMLGSRLILPPLSTDDVLFWRNDLF